MTEEAKSVEKKVKAMPTDPQRAKREDSGNPDVCNVNTYHKLFSSEADLTWVRQGCTTAGIGCGDCKAKLIGNIEALSQKPREKKKELLNQPEVLDEIIRDGCSRARAEAQATLKMVHEAMNRKPNK